MSELSFTIEDRAGLPVLIDRRGGVRPAGLHERAMWKRIKELESRIRELEVPARIASDMKLRADELEAKLEKLEVVYRAARGMCHGYDWNKGTAASYHRADLVRAVNAIDPLPDQGRTELMQVKEARNE